MVKHALLVATLTLVGLTAAPAAAHAEDAFNMLDGQFQIGVLPVDGATSLTVALGLGVEHPVFKKTRVFGEYEWMWLTPRPTAEEYYAMVKPPERHATGQRAALGLRRELVGGGGHNMHAFLDGELGGGMVLANDNMRGLMTLPTGFVGLRVGYDAYSSNDDSPSRTFETSFMLRVVAVPDGLGVMTGLGMAWGN